MAQKGKGPYNGGELPWKSVPVYQDELHLLSVYNKETCTRMIIKKILGLQGRVQRGKVISFQRNYSVATKGVSVSTMHTE